MKTMIAMLSLLIASTTFAANLQAGSYKGTTEDGQVCFLKSNGQDYYQIGWYGNDGQQCGFFTKKSSQNYNVLKVSGGSEFSACKAKIVVDSNGTAVEADLGVGAIFKLGYDVTCSNLQLQ